MRKNVIMLSIAGIIIIVAIVYFMPGNNYSVSGDGKEKKINNTSAFLTDTLENIGSSTSDYISDIATSSEQLGVLGKSKYNDIGPQAPLVNPPPVIKAIYSTSWSAASSRKIDYFIDLIKSTELNAIVIDIKDFSGHVLYDSQSELVKKYKSKEVRISQLNLLIKKFHDEGIYVIGRQTVFQDPLLAGARPDLAIQKDVIKKVPDSQRENGSSTTVVTRATWHDNKGLAWIDPGAKDAWDYNIEIAKDAISRGFDEINFDYIRFPSDGPVNEMRFNYYDYKNVSKATQIGKFFEYLKEQTQGITISADLFGLVTVNNDDLGIGQNLKIAAPNFYAIAPMVYPSHYANGFIGYSNPADHPGEVVNYSMQQAVKKLITDTICLDEPKTSSSTVEVSTTTKKICTKKENKYMNAKLRPWLQDFNLGATYGADKVRAQITAVDKELKNTPVYNGWMLWNPSNVYTKDALEL